MKIVVLGDGLLGKEISKQTGWEIISRKLSGFDTSSSLSDFIPKSCNVIVNCIAHTDTYSEEKDLHWEVNFKFVNDLVSFCNENNIKLVHIGTDYMYANNKNTLTTEGDVPVHSENWYGYTKLLGDGLIQLLSNNYLICRCIHKPYPFTPAISYTDRYANFDYTHNIAKMVIDLINYNANGVFNVGPKAISAYDFVKKDYSETRPGRTPNGYPTDTSMLTSKFEQFIIDMNNEYTLIESCPITGSNDKFTYFDLGEFPLVNNLFDTREESINCKRYPLKINYFRESKLSVLSHAVNGEVLFKNYLFKSEVNIPYIQHCKDMMKSISEKYMIEDNDLIIDIGGNDGTLLKAFKDSINGLDYRYLNIDPSENLAESCKAKGINVLTEFFSLNTAKMIKDKAKVIISTNVFQHLKDINSFIEGVKYLLANDGIWVLEFPYWIHDLKTNQFDQTYHEHIYYYTVETLKMLMKKHGLEIIDAEPQNIHGGTLRLTMSFPKYYSINSRVEECIQKESIYNEEYYKNWGTTVKEHLSNCKDVINKLKKDGKRIAGFGAAAKGCIFLNAMGLTDKDLEFIIDDTDIKQNKYVPGTGLKVVPRDILKTENIDVILILAHNFSEYIIKSFENTYNGEFLLLLPEMKHVKNK